MGIVPMVKEYLDRKGVSYEEVSHPQVFSSIEEANTLGINADEIAKNLIIKIKEKHAFVVLPGGHKVDMKKVRGILGKHARLEMEEEMEKDFPGYELGAVPPLGEVFGFSVYVDRRLLDHETIIFVGGTHTDSIKMKTPDFINMLNPEIVDVVQE